MTGLDIPVALITDACSSGVHSPHAATILVPSSSDFIGPIVSIDVPDLCQTVLKIKGGMTPKTLSIPNNVQNS